MGTNTPPFAAPCVMIDLDYGTLLRQYVLDNPSATIFIGKDPSFITEPSTLISWQISPPADPAGLNCSNRTMLPRVSILAAVAAKGGNGNI